MKRFLAIGSILAALTLSACGVNEETKTSDEVPEMLIVDLAVPDTATVDEEVAFTAVVSQGGKIVDDADDVKFEVMNLTTGNKEIIDASLNKNKHYEIKYTFEANGMYDITSHVTARSMHTMPTKQVTVTGGEDSATTTEESSHGGAGQHHGRGATIDFAEGTATVGEAIMLQANASLSDAPLEGARVQFEIYRSDDDHHTWVKASEKEVGNYQTEFTFTESGTYEIQVHVTKGDDLHDHVTKTYTVK